MGFGRFVTSTYSCHFSTTSPSWTDKFVFQIPDTRLDIPFFLKVKHKDSSLVGRRQFLGQIMLTVQDLLDYSFRQEALWLSLGPSASGNRNNALVGGEVHLLVESSATQRGSAAAEQDRNLAEQITDLRERLDIMSQYPPNETASSKNALPRSFSSLSHPDPRLAEREREISLGASSVSRILADTPSEPLTVPSTVSPPSLSRRRKAVADISRPVG